MFRGFSEQIGTNNKLFGSERAIVLTADIWMIQLLQMDWWESNWSYWSVFL